MYRKLRLLLALTLPVSTIACGGGGNGAAATAPPPSSSATAITIQPSDQTVSAGQAATFTVAATGAGSLTYQWQRDASPIAGATASSYTTGATAAGDSGSSFAVVVGS